MLARTVGVVAGLCVVVLAVLVVVNPGSSANSALLALMFVFLALSAASLFIVGRRKHEDSRSGHHQR